MQKAFNFISKFKEYIAFAALIVISLSLISIGDTTKIGGFRAIVIASLGTMQDAFSWIPNPGALKSENRAIRSLNLRQSAELARMRTSLVENSKLRSMIGFRKKTDIPVISAEISGKTTVQMRNYVTLDKGAKSGIKESMAVRTDAGLVGIVTAVSDNYSLVELIRNRNVKISAKIQRNLIKGIVEWEGADDFYLKNIPTSFDVEAGDVVITSNYSNKYPKNVPIGEITEISEDHGSLFLRIKIKPFVNFSTMEQVFVIDQLPDPERNAIIRQMEEKLKTLKPNQ
ncbi:MAG: rod shape-determining protein MreC [Candidatus Kapaibacterium sp.]